MVVLKVNMKHKKLLFLGLTSLLLTACSQENLSSYPEKTVLCVMSGYDGESAYQNDIYRELINNNQKKYNVNLNLYDLGNTRELFQDKFSAEINNKAYDYIVVFGDDLSMYTEKTIKTYQGYKFIYFDNESEEKYDNTTSFNFSPEEFGALAAKKVEEKGKNNIAYFYKYQNHFNNRKLYSFYNNLTNSNIKVAEYNLEEKDNKDKTETYISRAKSKYSSEVFFEDTKTNYEYVKTSLTDDEVVFSTYSSEIKNHSSYIYKDYNKMFDSLLKGIAEGSIDFTSNHEFGIEGEYLSATGVDYATINNSKFDVNKYDELDALKDKFALDLAKDYETKDSVYGKFHEAVPHCDDVNDWKYNPRPGGDCSKPKDWKALGIWSTIYAQDGMKRTNNTGIEFQNMRIYGYSSRKGWVFLEHANPVGSFYDENFVNDYNKNFEGKYFNNKNDKKTRILLDKETYGFNYHPFGRQTNLEELDMLDIEYVYSTMDIRLITWDTEKPSDINDAKYVANIGGDWWVYVGATWKPDWSANRDVAVGQFRTITKEWKTLEMCSVPLDKIDQILGNKEFLNK